MQEEKITVRFLDQKLELKLDDKFVENEEKSRRVSVKPDNARV